MRLHRTDSQAVLHGGASVVAPQTLDPGRISEWLLGPPLAIAVAFACAIALATWIPNYLTWPWWSDLDAHASLARAWDAVRQR